MSNNFYTLDGQTFYEDSIGNLYGNGKYLFKNSPTTFHDSKGNIYIKMGSCLTKSSISSTKVDNKRR